MIDNFHGRLQTVHAIAADAIESVRRGRELGQLTELEAKAITASWTHIQSAVLDARRLLEMQRRHPVIPITDSPASKAG